MHGICFSPVRAVGIFYASFFSGSQRKHIQGPQKESPSNWVPHRKHCVHCQQFSKYVQLAMPMQQKLFTTTALHSTGLPNILHLHSHVTFHMHSFSVKKHTRTITCAQQQPRGVMKLKVMIPFRVNAMYTPAWCQKAQG